MADSFLTNTGGGGPGLAGSEEGRTLGRGKEGIGSLSLGRLTIGVVSGRGNGAAHGLSDPFLMIGELENDEEMDELRDCRSVENLSPRCIARLEESLDPDEVLLRGGKVWKALLALLGPNGSAKSTMTGGFMSRLEKSNKS